MAVTFTRRLLTGSSLGRGVSVAATASPGTTIHRCEATATTHFDEVWLWASNRAATAVRLDFDFGGTASAHQLTYTILAGTGTATALGPGWFGSVPPMLVSPGFVLQATTATIAAFATLADAITIHGYVNHIAT